MIPGIWFPNPGGLASKLPAMPVDLLLVYSFTCALLGAFRVSDEKNAANCVCLRSATRGVLATAMVTSKGQEIHCINNAHAKSTVQIYRGGTKVWTLWKRAE